MYAQYEEKTYESYFNTELDRKTSIYFPFGQVQEGVMGLDAAAHSQSGWLWRMLGYPFFIFPHFSGVELQSVAEVMEDYLGREVRNIPAMKVNLLFQYKRPEIFDESGTEWPLWEQRYFRYTIEPDQHNLLAHLESTFGADALVLYAAPAVENVDELVSLKLSGNIIRNSNYRRASDLNTHHYNTYIKAGCYSQACSEPHRLDNLDLIKLIEGVEPIKRRDNKQFLMEFTKQIAASMIEAKYIKAAFDKRLSEFNEFKKYELLFAMISMGVFKEVTGTQWLVSLGKKAEESKQSDSVQGVIKYGSVPRVLDLGEDK